MEEFGEGFLPEVEVQPGAQGHQELLHRRPEVQVRSAFQEGLRAFDGRLVKAKRGRGEGKSRGQGDQEAGGQLCRVLWRKD